MGGSRGGGNRELEDLQKRALEDELENQERLEADLEARRRTRFFGGRRGQLRFLGPLARQVRRSEERGQEAVTPATPSAQAATAPSGRAESSPGAGSRTRIGNERESSSGAGSRFQQSRGRVAGARSVGRGFVNPTRTGAPATR